MPRTTTAVSAPPAAAVKVTTACIDVVDPAARAFVAALRAAQSDKQRCCAACGDDAPGAPGAVTLSGRATAGMPQLPTTRIVPTYGCRAPSALRELDWANVCRLQLQDACKYGDSCRNVHIC